MIHSYINPYLDQKIELMALIDYIKNSKNAALLQSYNSALVRIEDRERGFIPSYAELLNEFRLTEEQINFIRK